MANSGIIWIDWLFNLAVRGLYACAEILGMTYEEINVSIFCISWPLTMLVAGICIYRPRRRIARLRRSLI